MISKIDTNKKTNLPQDMLVEFFRYLNKTGFPYVVVGNTLELPYDIPGDIDLVFPQDRLDEAAELIHRFTADNNARVIKISRHETTAFCMYLAWQANCEMHVLKLDYCGDYIRHARRFIDSSSLLRNPVQVKFEIGELDFFNVPSPDQAFLYYLPRRLDKRDFTPESLIYLRGLLTTNPSECESAFLSIWPKDYLQHLDVLLNPENSKPHALTIDILLKHLYAKRRIYPSDRFREIMRLIYRRRHPLGLFAVIIGPDGSGKSTVIDGFLNQSQKEAFDGRTHYQHLRPSLFMGKATDSTLNTDPHGQAPYGTIKSVFKLFYLVADYLFGYIVKTVFKLQRSTLVVYDRYYHDLLIDPLRSRYGGPTWLVRLLGVLVPKPDIMLVLDVEAKTILARKQEVTLQECERQVLAYRQLADDYPFSVLIDANQPVKNVVEQANHALIEKLAQRQAMRDGR